MPVSEPLAGQQSARTSGGGSLRLDAEFLLHGDNPGLIDELWAFAKSAYLDSPLPSLFKERLFVYLSRFCAVRYCIVRHVGFLIGEGCPAGDTTALPETIDQVIALLTRPARCARALEQALARLEALIGLASIPAPRTELESDLLDALTVIFLEP